MVLKSNKILIIIKGKGTFKIRDHHANGGKGSKMQNTKKSRDDGRPGWLESTPSTVREAEDKIQRS
jgi:hypothetical protein